MIPAVFEVFFYFIPSNLEGTDSSLLVPLTCGKKSLLISLPYFIQRTAYEKNPAQLHTAVSAAISNEKGTTNAVMSTRAVAIVRNVPASVCTLVLGGH